MRLVAKGYAQQLGIDFHEIFSLVVLFTTIKVVLAIAVIMDSEWLDIKATFLHGDLKEEIYITQPEDFIEK